MINSFRKYQKSLYYRFLLNQINKKNHFNDLNNSAIIFSPHFDDETLGCGGTIIKKKQAGADIKIVFMTDGSKSHSNLISEKKLSEIRMKEAFVASNLLGVDSCDLHFLNFQETKLFVHKDAAIEKVFKILTSYEPCEIFVPYNKEPTLWSEDHVVTNRIVIEAIKKLRLNIIINEYPVWFWYHWPWVKAIAKNHKELLHFIKLNPIIGLLLLRHFQHSVYIRDIIEKKRAALNKYRSQMNRLIPEKRWQTLSDVSNGEFLDCFFQDHEIFHRYVL